MYPLILTFHKIIPDEYIEHPYFWDALCTPYTAFISLIESLYQENFAFISLQELEYAMMSPKERTVLLTFDDGYHNNILYAYPFLKAENIPFVIALNGKCTEQGIWQWFDRVWYQGVQLQKKKSEISSLIQQFKYDIPALKKWSETALMPENKTEAERIFFDIALVSELKTLENVSFVSHTYSHFILTALSETELKRELSLNLDFFDRHNLKTESAYFVLPNGSKKDFNPLILGTVAETHAEYVFSMLPYSHHRNVLPRYTPVYTTWQKEVKRYKWQRFLYKWYK